MHVRGGAQRCQLGELDVLRGVLEVLDVGVVVLTAELRTPVYVNTAALSLVESSVLPARLSEAVESYVMARRSALRPPRALRVEIGGRAYYVRVIPSAGAVPLEVVFLRQEVLRDVEVLRVLERQFGITRREYQIVCALRLGKTNRQIAVDVGIAEGTVARHVHRLLQRIGVNNRTQLVHLVDELVKHAG